MVERGRLVKHVQVRVDAQQVLAGRGYLAISVFISPTLKCVVQFVFEVGDENAVQESRENPVRIPLEAVKVLCKESVFGAEVVLL